MHYLVDGHNLIGQLPQIQLSDPEDEQKLIRLLHAWTLRNERDQITVVFDRGVYGPPGQPKLGRLEVIFARSPADADARLIHRLQSLSQPNGYTLVSADRAIVEVAAERGVAVKPSQTFATELNTAEHRSLRKGHRRVHRPRPEPKLSRRDVDEWLALFGDSQD